MSASKWKNFKNSFTGSIKGIDEIYVDNFEVKDKRFYFLSHMHSDHFGGLMVDSPDQLISSDAKIYMTEESCIIFREKYRTFYCDVENQIKILQTGERIKIGGFHVTTIPVEHMVGAVMFLFETGDQKILYTGDFVIKPEDLTKLTALHDKENDPIKINLIYYDNTFSDIPYLPEREQCTETLLDEMKKWLDEDDLNAIGLHTNYDFAYEDLYETIRKKFGIDIYCENKYLTDVYKALSINGINSSYKKNKFHICEVDKTDKSLRFDTQRQNTLMDKKHSYCISANNSYKYKTFYISAMGWWAWETGDPSVKPHKDYDWVVECCYPTHCSKEQIDKFLEYLSPTEAIPAFKNSSLSTPAKSRPCTLAESRPLTPAKRYLPGPISSDKAKRHLFD